MKKLFASILALLLIAAVVPFAASAKNVFDDYTIVCFGDSITERVGYVKLLSEALGTNIINAGVSGNKVNQAKDRFKADVLDKSPDIVVICFGMNDQAAYYGFKDMAPCTDLNSFFDTLDYFADTLMAKGADVIFVTPNYVNTDKGYYDTPGAWDLDYGYGHMDDFCDAIREVALVNGCGLVDVNMQSKKEDSDKFFAKGDGVHPAQYGYSVYAKLIEEYMRAVYENKNAKTLNVTCKDETEKEIASYTLKGAENANVTVKAPVIKSYELADEPAIEITFGKTESVEFGYTESRNVAPKATYEIHDLYRMGGAEVNWGYSETAPIVYGDETGDQLTDGKHALSTGFGDTAWIGLSVQHPNYPKEGQYFLFKLDKEYDIGEIRITVNNALENSIAAPGSILALASKDGVKYEQGVSGKYEKALVKGESAVYVINLDKTCSYIKLMYKPGSGNWMFTDEVEIYKAPDKDYLVGDVDGNNKVDAKDYMLLKRHCLKTFTLDDAQCLRADIDGNTKIDAKDYGLLKRACLGTYTIK